MALGIGRCLLEKRKGHNNNKRDRESDHKSSSSPSLYLCRFLSNAVWSFLSPFLRFRVPLQSSLYLFSCQNLLTEEKVFLWICNFSNLLLFLFFFRFHRTLRFIGSIPVYLFFFWIVIFNLLCLLYCVVWFD